VKEAIIEEFHEICLAQRYISEGGIEYARQILDQALGADKASELIRKLSSSLQVRPFDFVRKADPAQVINFLQNEHPQTIALILSYLDATQAAAILGSLPQEKQASVIARIATMGATSPEYIREAERILERKLSTMGAAEHTVVGGIDSIVAILNAVDRSTEKHILETLDEDNGELADEIRSRMFVFEDIVKLSNQAVQRVLKEVDNNELAIALKGATKEVSQLIFNNISKRLQDMIKEDMEFMGPVRVRDVEEHQQKIVNIIRRLEDSGDIIISRGQEDEVIV
jgi:flagellar motor switch protein FliG